MFAQKISNACQSRIIRTLQKLRSVLFCIGAHRTELVYFERLPMQTNSFLGDNCRPPVFAFDAVVAPKHKGREYHQTESGDDGILGPSQHI